MVVPLLQVLVGEELEARIGQDAAAGWEGHGQAGERGTEPDECGTEPDERGTEPDECGQSQISAAQRQMSAAQGRAAAVAQATEGATAAPMLHWQQPQQPHCQESQG